MLLLSATCGAQTADASWPKNAKPISGFTYHDNSLGGVIKRLPKDQFGLWTSPFHLRPKDMTWLVPAVAGTALLIHYDHQAYNAFQVRTKNQRAVTISNVGVAALAGLSAATYGVGLFTGSERAHEAGLLSAEAGINAVAVNEAIK